MFQSAWFWLLLPPCAAIFWLLPSRWRSTFLAAASCAGLAVVWPSAAVAVGLWGLAFYLLAPLAAPQGGGRRWVLWALIGSIIAFLVACKVVLPPILPHLARWRPAMFPPRELHSPTAWWVPVGASYFTFKLIHYAIEVARGNVTDRAPDRFFCYLYLWPTFVQGPIERYDHFLAHRQHRWSARLLLEGGTRIAHGLIKWLVLGSMLFGPTYDDVSSGRFLRVELPWTPPYRVWWVAVQLYLYGYMNFAGYTDVAIGASRLFGVSIMENFDNPLLATNPASFWRRWHMTLAGWCQSYVYLPVLGATRRPNVAAYASFLVIGLWHAGGGTPVWPWALWGLYHGTGVVLYGQWARLRRRRRWTWAEGPAWAIGGVAFTIAFISVGELMTFGGARSFGDLATLGRALVVRSPMAEHPPAGGRHRRGPGAAQGTASTAIHDRLRTVEG